MVFLYPFDLDILKHRRYVNKIIACAFGTSTKKYFVSFVLKIMFVTTIFGQATVPLWTTQPVPPPLPKAEQSGFAPVNHTQHYYGIYNERVKNPVILHHGGFVSSAEWGFEVPLLARTHKVIVVDNRGDGRSPLGSVPLSYDLMCSDVLKLMDYLKLQKVSIVGWSDCEIIGLILAIKQSEQINKLFRFGANFNLTGYKDEPSSDPESGKRFMARAEDQYRKVSATPDNFPLLKKALGKLCNSEPDLKPDKLKTIKVPTVISCGEYYQFIKPEHFRELANLIPSSKLVVIPNVSHSGRCKTRFVFARQLLIC